MSYEVIGASAKDNNFQNRCWGAITELSRDIIAAPQDSRAIMDDAVPPNDLTQESSKNQAKKFTRLTQLATRETIANQILLNVDIAANPMGVEDPTILYQTKQAWMTFVEIG